MNRNISMGIGAVLTILVIVALYRLFGPGAEPPSESAPPDAQVEVKVIHPAGAADTLSFDTQGRVTAKRNHSVAALSEGKIKTVYTAVNEPVRKGQVIALLENPQLDRELVLQENKVQLARTTVQALEKKVKSSREMLSLGILSQNELASQEQDFNARQTELHDQEIAYEKLKAQSGNYRVVSDVSGYISEILPEESFVTYGQTVAGIISLQDEQVEAFVPFGQSVRPGPGDRALISAQGATVPGKVISSYPAAGSNLVTVLVAPESPLPLNLEVKVTFKTRPVQGLMIPKSAVVMNEGKPVVFLVKNSQALMRPITVEKDYLDKVIISDDFGPDAALVTENAYLLADSVSVKVLP